MQPRSQNVLNEQKERLFATRVCGDALTGQFVCQRSRNLQLERKGDIYVT